MSRNKTIAAIVIGVLSFFLIVGVVFGQPLRKTDADAIALSYGGGPFEGKQFQEIILPGSGLVFNGWFDEFYSYPTTQRDYIVSNVEGEGDRAGVDAILCADKDKVSQTVNLAAAFKLNTNLVREFHERVGFKFHAWNGGSYKDQEGWDAMLNNTFRKPLETSVVEACRRFTTDELRSGEGVLRAMSEEISTNLKGGVTALLGEEYFCGPNFKIGQKECPQFEVVITSVNPVDPAVSASYDAQKVAANKVVTETNNAKAKEQVAIGEQKAKDAVNQALTPEYLAYLRIQAETTCAKSDKCTLVITQGGTGVNVNTGP